MAAKNKSEAPQSMFHLGDEHLFRLFDTEERNIVVEAISHAHDMPALGHSAPDGRRAELASKLRERLLSSITAYIDRLHLAGGGYKAPEFQAAVTLLVEITQVAETLENSEGATLSGDDAVALGQTLYSAWTSFIGDAAARRIFVDAQVELANQARRSETNRDNASKSHIRRSIEHDDVLAAFNREVRAGHTEREARGRLKNQGVWSQSTIYRVTKPKKQ